MKRFWMISGGSVGLLILIGLWFNQVVSRPATAAADRVTITIKEGDGVREVADQLLAAQLITQRWHWNFYLTLTGKRAQLQSGEFVFTEQPSIRYIANILTTPPAGPEEIQVKLLEGWSSAYMADVLDKAGVVTRADFLQAVENGDVEQLLPDRTYAWLSAKPASASLEGFLFPDTYRFFVNSTPAQVLGKLLDNFDAKYTAAMRQQVADQDRDFYAVLTLASIVERELQTDTDRAMAADLFLRRIENGIPLQSDATVNFVTGKSLLRPTLTDLEVDSPYNTYKYRGLPPGPIGNPGVSALRAAINPEPNEYFYFLTGQDGKTRWARTLEEHRINRERYLE